MDQEKTAIILTGGGMRCAHGGGFLFTLATTLGITSPDIIIGSSGNAGNALYYAAGQYSEAKTIWETRLSTPRFISFLRPWEIMNVDYLIDTVFKQQEPLNTNALRSTRIEWFVPITDFETGVSRYVGAQDHVDPFEILRAAKAIPVFFGKKIQVLGRPYVDGELGATIEDHVRFACSRGARRIVIVSNTPKHTPVANLVMHLYASFVSLSMREAIIRDVSDSAKCVTLPGVEILCIVPEHLPATTATRNPRKLIATFDRGVQDALAHEKELRTLLV